MGSHTVIVALPLSIITIFCFGYILMQQPQTLKKDYGTAASKRPSLFTGKAVPSINDPSLGNTGLEKLPMDTSQASSLTATGSTAIPTSQTSNPQTPMATNPQSTARQNTGGDSYSTPNKAKPPLSVTTPLSKLLDNL